MVSRKATYRLERAKSVAAALQYRAKILSIWAPLKNKCSDTRRNDGMAVWGISYFRLCGGAGRKNEIPYPNPSSPFWVENFTPVLPGYIYICRDWSSAVAFNCLRSTVHSSSLVHFTFSQLKPPSKNSPSQTFFNTGELWRKKKTLIHQKIHLCSCLKTAVVNIYFNVLFTNTT